MNIEVGEYIRTKYGITQFKAYETMNGNKLLCMPVKDGSNGIFANIEDIIKSSPNIIDLIEVGDFVKIEYFSNRYLERVERIFEVNCIYDKSVCFENGYCTLNILRGEWSNQDKKLKPIIKSIVTKQQFSNMEYRL